MARTKPYTKEFRDEAVRMATTSGKSIAQVARDLGISFNALRGWIRQAESRPGLSGPGHEPPDQRIRQLERENALLR